MAFTRFKTRRERYYRKSKEELDFMCDWWDNYWEEQSARRHMKLRPLVPVAFLQLKSEEQWLPFIKEVYCRYHLRDETIRLAKLARERYFERDNDRRRREAPTNA